jgi:trehalose 6-phosphate synthase
MFAHLSENDIARWADRFLSALAESRRRPGLLDGIRHLFAPRSTAG